MRLIWLFFIDFAVKDTPLLTSSMKCIFFTGYELWFEEGKVETGNFILIPFNFEEINASNRMRQKVPRSRWTQLQNICNTHGILPPTFGSNTNIPIAHLKKVKTRKRKNSK